MRRSLATTLAAAFLGGLVGFVSGTQAGGTRVYTSACFKMSSFRASNGKTYRVKMPRGQACFDKKFSIKGGAHVASRIGGNNPSGAINAARSMNRRNIVFVVMATCQSACWIQWNFMKKKCWVGNEPPTFRQHATTTTGRKINPHSRSRAYWVRVGREGTGRNWIKWTPPARYRCSEAVMAMRSTSGNSGYGGRGSFRQDRGRTPGRFFVRSQH